MSAQRGAALFKMKCAQCHNVDSKVHNTCGPQGPSLRNVYGSRIGHEKTYQFSKEHFQYDVVWDDDTLDAFLARSKEFIPGSKHYFHDEKSKEVRDDLIAYLKSISKKGSKSWIPWFNQIVGGNALMPLIDEFLHFQLKLIALLLEISSKIGLKL